MEIIGFSVKYATNKDSLSEGSVGEGLPRRSYVFGKVCQNKDSLSEGSVDEGFGGYYWSDVVHMQHNLTLGHSSLELLHFGRHVDVALDRLFYLKGQLILYEEI